MDGALWAGEILLATILLATGLFKLTQPRQRLLATGHMDWVEDVSDGQVRGIASLELLAAAGLVLPELLDVATWLTPLAAMGVVALMIGAGHVHARRGETEKLPLNAVIGLIAALVAVGQLA
ncbi:MAG TPA: DoxX family protein [Solirubrobacteraceae bacterium]|nr:DoxX family protein [Solirubrobacteraceae bacterium]